MDAYRPITTSAKLSLPLNGTVYTTTRKVAAETPLPEIGATMAAILGTAFATSRVIEANETPDGEGHKIQTVVHALIPTEAAQLANNWEFASCSIGGQKFYGVTRTFIYLASAFSDTSPALGSAMPISAGTTGSDYGFTGDGYILTGRNAGRSGMQLEPVFKVEVREYVKRVTMTNIGVDNLNGLPLFEITTLYHAGETLGGVAVSALFTVAQAGNAFWGIQSTGFENAGQQLSAEWFAVVSSQVVAGTIADGVVSVSLNVPSNDEYTWPPVLQHVDFMDWAKREGGEDIFPLIVYSQMGYRGPCRTETTRTWSKTAFTIAAVAPMLPNGIHYASPFFSLSIPPCLHGDIPCVCDIGNADPEYTANAGSLRVFKATNHTVWPVSIVAYDDQEPYRGGYLRTRRVAYPSAGTGGGAPVVTITPPSTVTAQSVGSTGVTLGWIAPANATSAIAEIATDALFANLVRYQRSIDLEQIDIVGLTPSTSYWARVSTLAGSFKSAPSSPVTTFTTSVP